MKNINPKIILPVVALVLMLVQKTTGLTFENTDMQVINDAALSIVALFGIFSNPKKED